MIWTTPITLLPKREKVASPLKEFRGRIIAVTGGYIGDAPPYQGHVAVLDAATGNLLAVWNSLCSDRAGLIDPTTCPESDSAIWGRAGAVMHHHFTFRPSITGMTEERLIRGLHPQIAERLRRSRDEKVRALLFYLVVESECAHSRESLIGLLWPDIPEEAARANLRQALACQCETCQSPKHPPLNRSQGGENSATGCCGSSP